MKGWELRLIKYENYIYRLRMGAEDALVRVMELGGYSADKSAITKVAQDCGCGLSRIGAQRPIVRTYVPTRCGSVVGLDIMYPVENSRRSIPFVICVDLLIRYTIFVRLKNHNPEHAVDMWCQSWLLPLGKTPEVIADRGPAFVGEACASLADLMDFHSIMISREKHRLEMALSNEAYDSSNWHIGIL